MAAFGAISIPVGSMVIALLSKKGFRYSYGPLARSRHPVGVILSADWSRD
jgi:hypothetical protein